MKHKLIFCAATVAIFAACLFEPQAATYNLTVLANKHTHAWSHFAEMGVATDHMNGAIHTVWGIGWGGDLKAIHDQGVSSISGDMRFLTLISAWWSPPLLRRSP